MSGAPITFITKKWATISSRCLSNRFQKQRNPRLFIYDHNVVDVVVSASSRDTDRSGLGSRKITRNCLKSFVPFF